jgi:hypothetical protein
MALARSPPQRVAARLSACPPRTGKWPSRSCTTPCQSPKQTAPFTTAGVPVTPPFPSSLQTSYRKYKVNRTALLCPGDRGWYTADDMDESLEGDEVLLLVFLHQANVERALSSRSADRRSRRSSWRWSSGSVLVPDSRNCVQRDVLRSSGRPLVSSSFGDVSVYRLAQMG